ncbi:Uncharacterised protein [Mycobacteroides abscessus subsp. abscessus]|nr:Uncharacterised protein [Mycobacteroides abscessus subsp. abscessus]
MDEHYESRETLAHCGLNRHLLGMLSEEHFLRYLRLAVQWTGEGPVGTAEINELVAASASSKGYR